MPTLPERKTSKENLYELFKSIESLIDSEAQEHKNYNTGRVEFHMTDISELKYAIAQLFSNCEKSIAPPVRSTPEPFVIPEDELPF